MKLLTRLAMANDGRKSPKGQSQMCRSFGVLVSASRKGGMQMIADMAHFEVGPPFAIEGMTLLIKVMAEITHEMIGTLVAFPYFDVLKVKTLKA